MHAEISKRIPDVHLHVVGDANTRSAATYFNDLKERFQQGVTYHGYVPEGELDKVFSAVGHVILPFQHYKYTCSVSGSVLGSLRRNKIVWTTPVNSIPELIVNRQNGLYLSLDLQIDVNNFLSLLKDAELTGQIREGIAKTLRSCSAEIIVEEMKRVQ
jgi:glycosyltransferase involved in cell wall biosynthesis